MPSGNTSHLDIAVNSPNGPTVNGHPGDPTNPWIVYQIDTTDPGGNGCPCFGDQPRIGIDSQNLYVTDDEFSINGPQFDGGEIYAFSKKDLVALKPTVHFVHFPHLSVGGTTPLAPQPALTTGSSSAEYFLGSLDPNGTFDQRLAVWAMTNTSAVSTGGKPTLSSLVLTSEAYGVPPGAEQKGTTSLLDYRRRPHATDAVHQWEHLGRARPQRSRSRATPPSVRERRGSGCART